jgi:serine/threonine-protein kinase RsbT
VEFHCFAPVRPSKAMAVCLRSEKVVHIADQRMDLIGEAEFILNVEATLDMTMIDGIKVQISTDSDIISARQHGRALAERAGFQGTDLTLIVTAVSEVARKIAEYAPPGEIDISVNQVGGKTGIVVTARSHSTDGSQGLWLPRARRLRRLMDEVEIVVRADEALLTMKKWQPPLQSSMSQVPAASASDEVEANKPQNLQSAPRWHFSYEFF